MSSSFTFTTYEKLTNTKPTDWTLNSFAAFREWYENKMMRNPVKENSQLWSPAIIKYGERRLKRNITGYSAIVLDVDRDQIHDIKQHGMQAVADRCPFEALFATTHSHSFGVPDRRIWGNYHVILPLEETAYYSDTASDFDYLTLRVGVMETLGITADPRASDILRAYYLPPPSGETIMVNKGGKRINFANLEGLLK